MVKEHAMNIWSWIHRNGRTMNRRASGSVPEHFTAQGNAIDPEWRSGWSPDDDGVYETRRHVGQSAEGFHAGVELSRRISDGIVWSEAYPTPEKARGAAREMESTRWREIEAEPSSEPVSARSESGLALLGD
jgi:hypothetical protein